MLILCIVLEFYEVSFAVGVIKLLTLTNMKVGILWMMWVPYIFFSMCTVGLSVVQLWACY